MHLSGCCVSCDSRVSLFLEFVLARVLCLLCVCVCFYDLRLLCFACVVFVCAWLRYVNFVFVDMFVVIGCVSDLACIERSCLFLFVCVSCLFVGVDGQFFSVVAQVWL